MIAGVVGLTVSNILILQQKAKVQHQKDIANEKADEALRESDYARAIADFVKKDLLALTELEKLPGYDGNSSYELSKFTTLRQLVDHAAEKLDARTDLDPRIDAELRLMIGNLYNEFEAFHRAIEFLEKSVELHRTVYGDDAEPTLAAQNMLAWPVR